MAEAGLLLAFDFGLRHIGWATGQHLTASATAGSALAAQEGTPNWQAVHTLLEEWQGVNRLPVRGALLGSGSHPA